MSKNKSSVPPTVEDYYLTFLRAQRNLVENNQKSSVEKVQEQFGEGIDVVYNEKVVYSLNASLVLRQGLDVSELRNLKCLHAEKLKYFDLMRDTDDSVKLKEYAHEVECIEFEMQKNWHFPQDRNFHEWYKVPKCTCPKLDNSDNRGTQWRVVFSDCPVHGS